MEKIVASYELPVREKLELRKNRIEPRSPKENRGKRLCVITGTHGDELEGQLVEYLLNQRFREHPEYLHGTVDIYPAINPLGINTITRGMPLFDLDLNRIFPGNTEGSMAEFYARAVVEDIRGADFAVDIHASNIYLRELPQIRISEETAPDLLPLAKLMNVNFVWVHSAATVLESTLAHSLNVIGTKCLVAEMGVGMRLTPAYGEQLTEGILNLMKHEGMWDGETNVTIQPVCSKDKVEFLNADAAGIFIPCVEHNGRVKKGQKLAVIADPETGVDKQIVTAPEDGLLFTLREYPVVYPGSLVARILTGGSEL